MRRPEDHAIGANGIVLRPNGPYGARIDIPANGEKPLEILHYLPAGAAPQPPPVKYAAIDASTLDRSLDREMVRGFTRATYERFRDF